MPRPSPVGRLRRFWDASRRRLQLLSPQRFISCAELQRPIRDGAHFSRDDRGVFVYELSGRGDNVPPGI